MLSITINGDLVTEPQGLTELKERVYFNDELSMFLNKIEGDIVFRNDGYDLLRGIFNTNACSLVEVSISDSISGDSYEGIIFINDITWNLSKCECECTIVSDKYIQSIDNNKGIKVQLGVGLTKGLNFLASNPTNNLLLPNPSNTTAILIRGWRPFDVFTELIGFMTDGAIGFVSDYFDPANGNDAAYSIITRGAEVRDQAGELTPLISYLDFFNDMNKIHNLAGVIEGNNIRIEPKSYFRQTGSSTSLSNIDEVVQDVNREQFYASIKMGSAKVADGYPYLIRLSYNGFQREQFFLQGECNINSELDLQLNTIITDTNIIQDIQPIANGGTNNTDYDDDIVMIHCDSASQAVITPAPLTTIFYYNEYLTNMQCSERWSETYPFSVLQLLEAENQLVRATGTTDQTILTNPSQNNFSPNDDSTPPNFDVNGDYQIGIINTSPTFTRNVGYFEAPSDMVVSVFANFYVSGAYRETRIKHVDAFGVTASPTISIDFTNINYTNEIFRNVYGGGTFYTPVGSRIWVEVDLLTDTDSNIHSGGTLEFVQVGAFGGVYKIINENDAYTSRVEFKYPVTCNQWSAIKTEPYKSINGTYGNGAFSGFIIDATRNINDGFTSIKTSQKKSDVK